MSARGYVRLDGACGVRGSLEQQNAKSKNYIEIGVDAEDYYKIKEGK